LKLVERKRERERERDAHRYPARDILATSCTLKLNAAIGNRKPCSIVACLKFYDSNCSKNTFLPNDLTLGDMYPASRIDIPLAYIFMKITLNYSEDSFGTRLQAEAEAYYRAAMIQVLKIAL